MGFKNVESLEFKIRTEIHVFMVISSSIIPGLMHSQL